MKKKPWQFNINCVRSNIEFPLQTDDYDGKLKYDYDTQKMCIYTRSSWVELNEIKNNNTLPKKYPTICPNCGAPHNPNTDCCEYCGTYF